MSQRTVINALICVAVLLVGAIVFQSIYHTNQREDRRSSATAPAYRPQLSPDVFARALDENAINASRKKTKPSSTRTEPEQNPQETRQLTASR